MTTLDDVQRQTAGLRWMLRSRADDFACLFRHNGIKDCLEVGTYQGVGACYLAAIVAPVGGHVVTVDLPRSLSLDPVADAVIARSGLTNITLIRHEDGIEGVARDWAAAGSAPQFDFVYHDAGHRAPDPIYRAVAPLLRSGGLLAVDDIRTHPEVTRFWNEVQTDPAFQHFVTDTHANYGLCRKR